MFTAYRKVLVLLGLSLIGLNAHAALTIAFPIPNPNGYSLWPKQGGVATVFYVVDSASDPSATTKIEAAIAIFNADFQNVIQWVPWTTSSPLPNYVDINLSAGDTSGQCEANEGYEAVAAQPMTGSTSCTVGTILHEMGHVIGLWHEQSRADAANYVTLNYSNVIKGSWSNFQPVTDNAQILGPYDYASVMQYIPYAFTRNGSAVIESIPAGIPLSGYEGVPAQAGATGVPAQPVFDYSAGDKETIRRLYGAAPTQITVTSNPVGLSVIVDGASITTPQTFAWPMFSSHTLDVPAEVQMQSGYILNSPGSNNPATFYYTYGRWNDSTAQMHTITVTPGNGSPTFPTAAPQVATYSANFIQLVPYSASISPTGSGTATVSPQPQTYSGVAGQYFVARQQATLSAAANTGWKFYEFNNGQFWLPGGLGANPKTFDVPDTGLPISAMVEFSNTPIYTVDITPETFSSNLRVDVDGTYYYTPKNFSSSYDSAWIPNSSHTLSVDPVPPYSINSRYNFLRWSDGHANSPPGTITAPLPATARSYIATVTPDFRPATNFDYPPCGGSAAITTVSPSGDGFYPTGRSLRFTATPDTGWTFAGWTYDKTGTTNPMSLVADDETLVFANFNTVNTPVTLTSLKPSSARAGAAGFVLTLTGTGFSPTSLVSANGQYRTVTYVNSKTMTVPMTAADITSAGAFQVFVENFPSGSNGCAVFGYQTFIVQGRGAPTATPVFSPKAGAYGTAQSVSISDAIAGATINYTTDGTTPTASSPVYNSTPITVSSTETLKASALASGYVRSTVAIAIYTIESPAATPVFSPKGGTYTAAQSVKITDATPGATIHYTTDGTTPTTSSPVYSTAIPVSTSETLKAAAVAKGFIRSAVAIANYSIK